MKNQTRLILFVLLLSLALLGACTFGKPAMPKELIYRDWEGAIPAGLFDDFTKETGIQVIYQPYQAQEEIVDEIRAGKVYDVVVLENQLIKTMVTENRLATLDFKIISNFKNISANFRDMVYDPHNQHSVPYSWGTTGMVVRTDLVEKPVTKWADLWDERYAGKITGWTLPRYMLGISLKSLGYSINSEKPEELEAALQHLIELKPHMKLLEWESAVSAPYLIKGEAVLAVGQADDVLVGQEQNQAIQYLIPDEGGILWGDNWTIPASSPNKQAAEMLINYLLRGEVSAKIINETYYWLPNDAALPLVKPEIRDNPAVFPASASVKNSEIMLPLTLEGEALYQKAWEKFLAAEN